MPTVMRRLLYREPWWAEFWAALGALIWSMWTRAGNYGIGLGDRPAWSQATRLMGEDWWQLVALLLGGIQIAVVLTDHRRGRRLLACAGVFFWSCLMGFLWQVDRYAPSLALYVVMFGINGYSLLRLRDED